MNYARITIACLFVFGMHDSHAVPIVDNGPCPDNAAATCSFGISDVELGGVLYDVTFVEGLFEDLFPDPSSTLFWGDAAGALAAVEIIAGLLNDQNNFGGVINFTWIGAIIPVQLAQPTGYFGNTGGNFGEIFWDLESIGPWMVFEVATDVPEPGTLAMLFAGLAGLAFARRRRV